MIIGNIHHLQPWLPVWGGDRLCMDGSSPRKQREALRDKA